jgi:hypothetical protein
MATNTQEVQAVGRTQVHPGCRSSNQAGLRQHDDGNDGEVLGLEPTAWKVPFAGDLHAVVVDEFLQGLLIGLDDQQVLAEDLDVTSRCDEFFATTYQGHDTKVAMPTLLQRLEGVIDQRAPFGDDHLGDVRIDVVERMGLIQLIPVGDQLPGERDHGQNSGGRNRQSHGRKIEDAVASKTRLIAKGRKDDVRRRSDQRDQAAEHRCKR